VTRSNELTVSRTATPRLKPDPDAELAPGTQFTDHAYSMRWTRRRAWQAMIIADRDELPAVRPTSGALNYGQSLIESLTAYRLSDATISVCRPDSYVKRLNRGAQRLALPLVDFDRAWGAIKALVDLDSGWLAQEPGSELYLRAVLAANGTSLDLAPPAECLFYLLASPARAGQPAPPASAMVTDDYAMSWPGGTGDVNAAMNYGATIVPGEIAANYGYQHVLWLDGPRGRHVKQVGAMNVFFVIDGELTTPGLDQRVFPGITRDCVIKLARDSGRRVSERPVELAEVIAGIGDGRVSECFGTGTAAGIVPICAIGADGGRHELAAPGPVTAYFRELLDGIHRGDLVDRFGWMRRLTEVAPVHV
jgi:branched-chain amino acid aminotransferase